MLLKLLGAAIFLWGAAVLGFGYNGTDLLALLPIELPDRTETFAPYIAMVFGVVVFFMANSGGGKRSQRF